ncbi:hypothetical protein CI109_101330 [Kwoniella shandongensis]|uniref:Uncharacterized protein n=1 Tax=Kwoniella shandongensis TaxID=1734106 RepID=A0A5M6BY19_9TREE|nr:uncharacterized protein CI109_005291 [Kwoniella shandongensis]KAA5526335.1 hypothetical protein CI109_005291 [Kwoniella shandongensis]
MSLPPADGEVFRACFTSCPNEILLVIIQQIRDGSDTSAADLNSLQQCSRRLYGLTNPTLYRHVELSPKNSRSFFDALLASQQSKETAPITPDDPSTSGIRSSHSFVPYHRDRFARVESMSLSLGPDSSICHFCLNAPEYPLLLPNLKRLSLLNLHESNYTQWVLRVFAAHCAPLEHLCFHGRLNDETGYDINVWEVLEKSVKTITYHNTCGKVTLPRREIPLRISYDSLDMDSEPKVDGDEEDDLDRQQEILDRTWILTQTLYNESGPRRVVAKRPATGEDIVTEEKVFKDMEKYVREIGINHKKTELLESKIAFITGKDAEQEPVCEACGKFYPYWSTEQ